MYTELYISHKICNMVPVYVTLVWCMLLTLVSRCGSSGVGVELVTSWTSVDFLWPSAQEREAMLQNGSYIPENNIICGIKVYKGRIFVTVPRWRLGVPSTLNELVTVADGRRVLKPFVSWNWQRVGDCDALQYVQSMEVDPNTGYMWIIDVGSVNTFFPNNVSNMCPAKLRVVDIDTGDIKLNYEFPDNVVSSNSNFLNDLVLDYVNGEVSYVYITDTSDAKIIVYDVKNSNSYFFHHSSMTVNHGYDITMNGQTWHSNTKVDGIALSPDFQYLYYCTLARPDLYRVPTEVLRYRRHIFSAYVEHVGIKASQSDGMVHTQGHLYFGGLSTNSLYRVSLKTLNQTYGNRTIPNQETVVKDDQAMLWVDTFSVDEEGNVWLIANSLLYYIKGTMDFDGNNTNMHLWKIAVGEGSYLQNANIRTKITSSSDCIRCYLLLYLVTLLISVSVGVC